MKVTQKHLRKVWMLCFMCFAFLASAQYSILNTGFEAGLPDGWVIENGQGTALWTHDATDTGNELPAKAYAGQADMLFFVDGVTSTQTSKLLTPKLDLTTFANVGVGEPLLTFWYANTGRILDGNSLVDTLRIYGRAQDTDAWTLLKTIDKSHDVWTKDTVELKAYALSQNYQICFEALNGNGRGVMLDEVKVAAVSYCGVAPNVRMTENTSTSVKLSWDGSQDVRYSELKVSSTPLTDMSQKADVYDGTVVLREYHVTGLAPKKEYYIYVRNYCGYEDYSVWSALVYSPLVMVDVPYLMDFEDWPGVDNKEYTDKTNVDTLNLPANWTYWKNEQLLKEYASAYQYYPYRGCGKTAAFNPSGEAKENRVLNIKGYVSTAYGTIESFTIMPCLNVDKIQKVQVTFDYKISGTAHANLRIGVVEDPADEGSFVVVDEVSAIKLGANVNEWKTVTVSFASYKGVGKYIAFQQEAGKYQTKEGGSSTTCYIDNIRVEYMPTCAKVTALRVADVKSDEVTLSWAGNADSYDLKVSKEPLRAMTQKAEVFDGKVNDLSYTLTGLEPAVSYKWYVKPSCSEEWSEWRFNTACEPTDEVKVPYTQNFDGYAYGQNSALPNGWKAAGTYSTFPWLYASNPHSAPASCQIHSDTQCENYLITPKLNTPLNQLQVTFMGYIATDGYKLRVGVMTDPSEPTTFTPIDTLSFNSKNQWQEFTVEFDKYKGDGRYIAFLVGKITLGPVMVDDVVIEKIPTCKMVESIDVANLTNSGFVATWTPRGNETEWTVCYGEEGFDVKTEGTKVKVTDKPEYKLTGLKEFTTYDVYVRAECGNNDASNWRLISATTLKVPAKPVGYRHDFSNEQENALWTYENGNNVNQWVVGTKALVQPGNPAAYASNNPAEQTFEFKPTSGNKTSYLYRTFQFAKGGYKISFNWKGFGNAKNNCLRAFLVPADEVLVANKFYAKYGTMATSMPETWICLSVDKTTTTENFYLSGDSIWSNGWKESIVDVVVPADGLYNVAFLWCENSASGSKCPVAIDNVAIDTCATPQPRFVKVKTDFIPGTKAELTWEGGEKAMVKILTTDLTAVSKRSQIENASAVVSGSDITTHKFVAEGLTVGKTYYYAIRTYDDTNKSDWAVGSFTTASSVATPYNNNFNDAITTINAPWVRIGAAETQAASSAPTMQELFEGASKGTGTQGWSKYSNNTSNFAGCETFEKNGFLRSVASKKKGSKGGIRYYAYSPSFIAQDGYQLRFDMVYINSSIQTKACQEDITSYLDEADLFAVLISKDMGKTWKQEDAHVWVLNTDDYKGKGYKSVNSLLDVANKGEGKFYNQTISLAEYAGDSLQVAFHIFSAREAAGTTVYCVVDNFYVGPKPCEQPKDLTFEDIQENSVKVTWTPGEAETAWRMKVSNRVLSNIESSANVVLDTIVTGQPSCVVTNLQAGHPYAVYLQSICDVANPKNGSSLWLDAKTFTTACPTKYTLPYVEKFDTYSLSTEHQIIRGCYHPCLEAKGNKEINKTYAYLHRGTVSQLSGGTTDYTKELSYGAALCLHAPQAGWVSASLPEMPKRVDSLMISFYATTITESGELQVGVYLKDEFEVIKTISLKQYEWQKVNIPFDSYIGNIKVEVNEEGDLDTIVEWGKNIALKVRALDIQPKVYIDNLTVEEISGCLPPVTFKAKTRYSNFITYEWSTRKYEEKYRLKVFTQYVDETQVATASAMLDTVVTGNSFTLNALDADRNYYACLSVLCADNEEAWSNMIVTRTACPPIYELPYRENFNVWEKGSSSACWTMNSNSTDPYADNKSTYVLDGMYLDASCSTQFLSNEHWQYYVLPKLNARMDTVQLSLMIHSSVSAAKGPEVGVMTNPRDTSTFVPICRLNPKYLEWSEVLVRFSKYEGDGQYIAFRQSGNDACVQIDNIEVTAVGCPSPIDGELLDATESTMLVKWNMEEPMPSYDVLYYSGQTDSMIVHVEGTEQTTITGLRPNTLYNVFVRTICEDKGVGLWRKIGERKTRSLPAQLPYYDDFSVAEQNQQWNMVQVLNTNTALNMWTFGTGAKENDTCLYISNNGSKFDYSSAAAQTYAYKPVSFAAGRHQLILDWTSQASMSTTSSSSTNMYDYMRIFLIDAMVDMQNISPMKNNGLYESNQLKNNSAGLNYLENTDLSDVVVAEISTRAMRDQQTWLTDTLSFFVPEDGVYYLAFYWNNYNSVRSGEKPAAVDNVKIEQVECATPEHFTYNAIMTGTEVELDWVNGKAWEMKVSSTAFTEENLQNADYTADVFNGVVDKKPYVITGLKPNTEYHCAVRTRCEDGTTSWGLTTIRTMAAPRTLPFYETFNVASTSNVLELAGWDKAVGYIDEVINGAPLQQNEKDLASSGVLTLEGEVPWVYGKDCPWNSVHAKLGIFTYSQNMQIFGSVKTSTRNWILTPAISIPEGDVKLTFDLALSQGNRGADNSTPIDMCEEVTGEVEDDKFAVLVSLDNGKSWDRENAIIWNDVDGDSVYSNIPLNGRAYSMDMSRYAGKIIRVAFAGESRIMNAYRYVHLDNVRISQTAQVALADTTCAGYAYRENGFEIPALNVVAQPEPYIYTRLVVNEAGADTLYTLSLAVGQATMDTIRYSICQGEVFEQFGFKVSEPGTYVNMATSTLGCDSATVLILSMNKSYRFEETIRFCSADLPYTWRGQTIHEAGEYFDTHTSVLGCDSVYVLNLVLVDNYAHTFDVEICQGDVYELGTQRITQAGTYAEPLLSVEGCDSVVTVNVTVNPAYSTTLEYNLCQGTSFEIGGKTYTKSGVYPLHLTAVTGCDSVVNYKLNFVEQLYTILTDTIQEGEVYNKYGFVNLTEEGLYKDTLQAVGGCDSIVVLTLIVEPVVAINEAYATTLTLSPNPVKKGGVVVVEQEFDADKIKVEIFSPIGAKVKEQVFDRQTAEDVRLSGFNVSGTYLIRITTDEGDIYMAKLIVL
ncbi:MAG: choice-of-anchor J domain-containing protein [Paludibacteraceae bacterium]|nr:choice-of-anchor J domain-containing protein [Paludibacteraceae bacterium]